MIREFLKDNVLLFDGAMGTYFSEKYGYELKNCENSNITDPDKILKIHQEYVTAGANAIKTNTFNANTKSLGASIDEVKEVINAGWEIACQASDGAFVFADIGPIPEFDNVFEEYTEIVDYFLRLGATNFLFETFSSLGVLERVCEYIKSKNSTAFIIVSFAINPDGFTREGIMKDTLIRQASACDSIDVVGMNCISGPYHMLQMVEKLDNTDKILSIMPNAGYPTVIGNRTVFVNNAAYFAEMIAQIICQGVGIVGGCCGSNPEYIRAIRTLITNELIVKSKKQIEKVKFESRAKAPNAFYDKLITGKKVIAVELDPPKDSNIESFMRGAYHLRDSGVDAITIADCPVSRASIDSSILACKLKRELNLDIIPHMTCRDRNLNATKALLLGLDVEGVNNVLVITGDPVPTAEREEIKSVFNFNSPMLSRFINGLNSTLSNGQFVVYGALNLNARNFSVQLEHARKKIDNGVSAFLTQPVLTLQALENLKIAREQLDTKILTGIMPIVSYKNACFISNEISGINVDERIINSFKDLNREAAEKLSIEISKRIINEVYDYSDGFYIITPFRRTNIVSDLVKYIKQISSQD